ncbi:hypothetical protein G4G28_19740 [Massilia sp. Dwa41.01b]|uniref:hypothetical protein n=1 Tax=unclassified Massilia TaxID=2609279 RepID=UPI0015FFE2B6|nr:MULTISPECIES: hypothetical protein [unclassified Massilia]QNA90176.1 hypothetical protein G4G28_19740 [Massilia sp. Dwa41.01b]QNB01068.1 hypothetical protein G4G31_23345 [Massilia sp. Se16.2.3]
MLPIFTVSHACAEKSAYGYKEAEVEVKRADSSVPSYIETRFYPDSSIHVVTTDNFSDPHFALDRKRIDQSFFPRSENDEKPEQ